MPINIQKLFARGLMEGFAGGSVMKKIDREGFNIKSSHFENKDGIYHDEWYANRAGGGQEIVKSGDSIYTRVYAGGTISKSALKKLGISEGEVMSFLKKQLIQNGEKIRFLNNFNPESEGDWQYSYNVIDSETEIPITTGKENIRYKEKLVFVHNFIISPIY